MKRILAYKAKFELLAGRHFWPRAKCGTKLAWTGPFGLLKPEHGIPRRVGAIQTGFGPQNWPKPARAAASNKRWIKK